MTTTTTETNGNGNGTAAESVAATGASIHVPLFPMVRFSESEFANLKMRLDLFDDMVVATRFDITGNLVDSYVVDPEDIAARLAGLALGTGPLPQNCLFFEKRDGQARIGLFIEPKVWTVHVSGEPEPWRVPLPAMIFVGHGTAYNLWALSGHNWPKPDTALFLAPCPNVSSGTYGVCRGNVAFPVAASDTMGAAVEAFFGSEFNGHLDNGKSQKHKKTILDMWRELHEGKARKYPVRDLVAAHVTLGQVIRGER